MNDDLDEMLKARHEVFVADLAAVLPPARLPHAPPPVRVPWTTRLGDGVIARLELAMWCLRGFRPLKLVASVSATSVALGVLLIGTVQYGQLRESSHVATQQAADVPTFTWSSLLESAPAIAPRTTYAPRTAGSPLGEPSYAEPPLPPPPGEYAMVAPGELTLLFRPNSTDLTEDDVDLLRALARALRESDQVSVVGHTARLGPPATAVELSLRRAEVVRQELVRDGAAGLVVDAYGDGFAHARPGVDARDRRVVVTVKRASA